MCCKKAPVASKGIENALRNLQKDKDYKDVTLVCEDSQHLEGQKATLHWLLLVHSYKDTYPDPLAYMRDANLMIFWQIRTLLIVGWNKSKH